MSLIENAQAEVAKMTPDQIRARLAQINTQKAKQKERQKEKNQNLTPEERAARSAKHKEYQAKNPEKFKEQRKAYNSRPEVIEKRKVYMKKRNEANKLLLARAKELGITAEAAEQPQEANA